MAGGTRDGRLMAGHRRSARQRAALRKAQLASARKRRRNKVGSFLKSAGVVAGSIAVSAAYYHANQYARDPGKAVRHAKAAHGFVTRSNKTPPAVKVRKPVSIKYRPSNKAARAALKRRR